MLEQIYKSETTIHHLRDGILGQYLDDFAFYLIKQEYSHQTLHSYFGLISKLSIWLQNYQLNLSEFNEQRINEFIHYRKKTIGNFIRKGDAKALKAIISFLRNKNIIPQQEIAQSKNKSIETLLEEFALYLVEEKGLTHSTIKREKGIIRQFLLKQFGKQTVHLEELSRSSLLAYINNSYKQYSSKNTQLIASVLRTFLHFLLVNGKVNAEFTGYIPSIPSYRTTHLPEFLTKNQVDQLLLSCDQKTASGCRNYAILLLLVRLGLRASEVLKLSLDDIDWQQGNIHIYGKRDKPRLLPLPHEVGSAIANYLKNKRPHSLIRQVFLRSRAPFQGLHNSSNISSIVHRALQSAGLSPRHQGAHLLRYTAASESLRCGATLFEIGDLLGHCSIDTTALYTKVDVVRLKELAMPWPIAQCGRI